MKHVGSDPALVVRRLLAEGVIRSVASDAKWRRILDCAVTSASLVTIKLVHRDEPIAAVMCFDWFESEIESSAGPIAYRELEWLEVASALPELDFEAVVVGQPNGASRIYGYVRD